jgi:hypothetical protein
VFTEIMGTPEKGIPEELLGKAHCIVIIPGMKSGAIGIGGKYGRGYAMCRNKSGVGWGAPAAMRIEGGSFGFQIGGQSTDIVMMNDRGMQHLLKSKFTLGGDASVAAGPVGREARRMRPWARRFCPGRGPEASLPEYLCRAQPSGTMTRAITRFTERISIAKRSSPRRWLLRRRRSL